MPSSSVHKSDKENAVENFERYYRQTQVLQQNIERVESITLRLKNKYKAYKETEVFVDFLSSTEKILLRAQHEKWDAEKLRTVLVDKEVRVASLTSGVPASVFEQIRDEFHLLNSKTKTISDVSSQLVKKHDDCGECKDFIFYLRDVMMVYVKPNYESVGFEQAQKEKLVSARMKSMAADGDPPLTTLEGIYHEFQSLLEGKSDESHAESGV